MNVGNVGWSMALVQLFQTAGPGVVTLMLVEPVLNVVQGIYALAKHLLLLWDAPPRRSYYVDLGKELTSLIIMVGSYAAMW